MDTDRELLELAAKAAGIEYHAYMDDPIFGTGINTGEVDVPIWNPLLDDGQALRLAVRLRLCLDRCPEDVARYVRCWRAGTEMIEAPISVVEGYEAQADPYAATRRAIVRAAAEIGKGA